MPLVLTPAVEETITVTSESPLLDEREVKAGTSVSQIELEKIPAGRDPWSLLTQTPGVSVDRQNVGGNESGQQSSFYYAGTQFGENDFLVDGMQITDMAATGASPTYYDMDQFSEVAITTGGSDVTKVAAGVSVNMVTKRGSNEFRGSARFNKVDANGFFGHKLPQSQPNFNASDLAPELRDSNGNLVNRAQTSFTAPRTREIVEYGVEAGGAVVQDRLWLWGSFGKNDILQNNAGGGADDTFLENTSIKVNAQLSQANSGVASWNNGDKVKIGRAASATRPDPTTWLQRGPSAFYRFEDTHVFSSNFFLTGAFTSDDLGFSLTAKGCSNEGGGPGLQGCVGTSPSWRNANGIWQDSYLSGAAFRPGEEVKLDSSYFFSTGAVNHELKVGGRLRTFESTSTFDWPGNDEYTLNRAPGHGDCVFMGLTGGCSRVVFHRGITPPVESEYLSGWAQDTMTFNRFTLNVGFRFDDQDGENLPTSVPANPVSDLLAASGGGGLPAISAPAAPAAWDYSDIVPRMGLTYALGADRDTLLRLSLAQFVEPLDISDVAYLNTAGDAYAIFGSPTVANGPWTPGNPLVFFFPSGYDPANPAATDESVNRIDPGLDPRKTTELILGAEHSLMPQLVIGATLTFRDVEDIRESPSLYRDSRTGEVRLVNAGDFVSAGNVTGTIPGTGQGYSREIFRFNPGGFLTDSGGDLMLNNGRGINHFGASVNVTKRLSNRWMLRGFIHFDDTEWDVPADYNARTNPNRAIGDADGDIFLQADTLRGTRFLQSSWSTNLNGMYQIAPDRAWGFNISGNIQGREGWRHAVRRWTSRRSAARRPAACSSFRRVIPSASTTSGSSI